MIGWGIGIVLAFGFGVVVGVACFAVFTVKLGRKLTAIGKAEPRTREELTERMTAQWKKTGERIEKIKQMEKEVATLKKRAPRSIPIRHRSKCEACGRVNESELRLDFCPKCGGDVKSLGTITSTPFIGEPS